MLYLNPVGTVAKCWGEEAFYKNLINKSYSFMRPVFLVYNFYKYFSIDTVFFFLSD